MAKPLNLSLGPGAPAAAPFEPDAPTAPGPADSIFWDGTSWQWKSPAKVRRPPPTLFQVLNIAIHGSNLHRVCLALGLSRGAVSHLAAGFVGNIGSAYVARARLPLIAEQIATEFVFT